MKSIRSSTLALFGALVFAIQTRSVMGSSTETKVVCNDEEQQVHPILCHMLQRVREEPEQVAEEMAIWAREAGVMVETSNITVITTTTTIASSSRRNSEEEQTKTSTLLKRRKTLEKKVNSNNVNKENTPVVFAHGMGDSCFNDGMKSLTQHTAQLLGGVYGVCIPTGKTQREDTINGYFLDMNSSVDRFAAAVKANPQLSNGFYGIGISQGNNVIRGYISMYNDPPVKTFISINGVNAGEGAVPHCIPKNNRGLSGSLSVASRNICDLLMEQASKRAYTDFAQRHSFQANYWRDPRPVERENYLKYAQLAKWNNEGQINNTLKENWAKTDKFVWVMAEDDGMVWPKEGEQWGAPDPSDPFNNVLPMKETDWYKKDLFGLKTAEEAGKNAFESFPGDHLRFSMEDFDRWVNTYLKD